MEPYKFTIDQPVTADTTGIKGWVIALHTGRQGKQVEIEYMTDTKEIVSRWFPEEYVSPADVLDKS